jgi:hypothetical protein
MNRYNIFTKIGRIGSFMTLFIAAVILFFWHQILIFIPSLTIHQLFGISMIALSVLILDFYKQIKKFDSTEIIFAMHQSIQKCINKVVSDKKIIQNLKIYASTTEIIMPVFKDYSNLNIKNCQIMLQELTNSHNDAEHMNEKTKIFIESWIGMKKSGKIENLIIKRYNYIPTCYYIIVDKSHLIHGLYYPSMNRGHSVDYREPILINSSTSEGSKMIDDFTFQFDKFFEC